MILLWLFEIFLVSDFAHGQTHIDKHIQAYTCAYMYVCVCIVVAYSVRYIASLSIISYLSVITLTLCLCIHFLFASFLIPIILTRKHFFKICQDLSSFYFKIYKKSKINVCSVPPTQCVLDFLCYHRKRVNMKSYILSEYRIICNRARYTACIYIL